MQLITRRKLHLYVGLLLMYLIGNSVDISREVFYPSFIGGWMLLYYLVKYLFKRDEKRQNNQMELARAQYVARLKNDGECIRVTFAACEIRSNDYILVTEGRTSHDAISYLALAAPMSTPVESEIRQEVVQSVIVYEHTRNGSREVFYSPVLAIDKITLSFLLDEQKETMLYVDKTDRTNYFFDLGFLARD